MLSFFLAHPRFYNQIFSGIDPVGLAGQFLTAAINTSMYTFEMGSILTVIEADLLQKMREMIGWSEGDGIFSPGKILILSTDILSKGVSPRQK